MNRWGYERDADGRRIINILSVGTLPPHPGGSAISGSTLLFGFAQLGHRVHAIAPITPEALRDGDKFAIQHPELRVTRFRVPHFETAPTSPSSSDYRRQESQQISRLLNELIPEFRPDVIFLIRETFAWCVPDIARTYRIPCVLRLAGGTTLGIAHGAYPAALATQLLGQYAKCDLIVSPAKHLADQLRRYGFHDIRIIPNAVDLNRFVPQPKSERLLRQWNIRRSNIVVAHISNLKSLKRPLDIVYSAKTALQENPCFLYLIIGDGQCRVEMENLCRSEGIRDSFRFVGWIDYESMPDYINLADIVVMPADAETQARVYLETQSCGRVLLASDIPGACEVIEDGQSGVLFPRGEIDSLTTQTVRLAANAQLRRHIGQVARQRVQAHSMKDAWSAYLDAFTELIVK